MKLNRLIHWVNVVKNIVNNARNDSLQKWISENTFHGVCLSGRCLSVGKYGTIIATQYIFDNSFSRLVVHLLLRCVRFEYFVEDVNFALKHIKSLINNLKLIASVDSIETNDQMIKEV